MQCPQCEQDNPQQARFCMGCRAGLTDRCAKCGTELPTAARCCPGCGEAGDSGRAGPLPLRGDVHAQAPGRTNPDSKAALEGERKQVKVSFADVQG
jgi:double zinc ribbon protein